ncbi:MAG TPA: LLM class flavin-dependent oxidoreductase [Candidatus Limnocylindrales bacterium]|nr:LLM class flavin-dependent oxidoreductase [Candidatus Limnocylindrales bacterium]
MRFGLLLPHFGSAASHETLLAGAREAERLGFDSLWVRDHLLFEPHGMEDPDPTFVEPFVTLAYLGGATSRIGLGTATVIPFRHPIHLAQCMASLDFMLPGRSLEMGIGAGNDQKEFEAVGLGDANRVELMRTHVQIARQFWQGTPVDFDDSRYSIHGKTLKPTPRAPVPVWWGGLTPASTRLAAEFCEGWLPGRIDFRTWQVRVEQLANACKERGRDMVLRGAVPVVSMADSRAEALSKVNVDGLLAHANKQRFMVKPASGSFQSAADLEGFLLADTPAGVRTQVERYRELGSDLLILDFRFRYPDWFDQMRTFRDDVMGGTLA